MLPKQTPEKSAHVHDGVVHGTQRAVWLALRLDVGDPVAEVAPQRAKTSIGVMASDVWIVLTACRLASSRACAGSGRGQSGAP